MKNKITKQLLKKKYINENKNPYQIAEELSCNHKTVRSYLRKFNIPLRTASEYNFLAHKNFTSPNKTKLLSKKSIAAHIAYICEGWHTDKSNQISFSNQDTSLIDLVDWCLREIYQVKNTRIIILANTKEQCSHFFQIYPDAKFIRDESRKNPIVRLHSGGKMLVRDVVQNAYKILSLLE